MKRQLHSRKGVTVAEVVIALVIIAAISAFTLSLIVMSIGVETKSESAIEVKNAAENAIECFRFARDNYEGEIAGLKEGESSPDTLSQLFFLCLKRTGDYVCLDGDSITADSKFVLEIEGCTITITQIAKEGKIGFSFVAKRGEEELENFTFPEGGAS